MIRKETSINDISNFGFLDPPSLWKQKCLTRQKINKSFSCDIDLNKISGIKESLLDPGEGFGLCFFS